MRATVRTAARALLAAWPLAVWPAAAVADDAEPAPMEAQTVHAFEAKRLAGGVESLDRYRGKVLLIVNTASQCGLTPQYEGLQALYERYHERGLEVLGFPSNDFMQQEPGSDAQIGEFCRANYGVGFPMFSKIPVKGDDAHPLYAYLKSRPEPVGGPVEWNFQKYLADREGNVVARFSPRTEPLDDSITSEIERLLGD